MFSRQVPTLIHFFPDGGKIVKAIQDYASQYCAAKSLPFTTAVMAMDCVCATLTTITCNNSISQTSINDLQVNGHKVEAASLKKLKYVLTHCDVGGKRKADAKPNSDHKRSRLRLHRTTISQRVKKLGDSILSLKADYLETCPYVGLIIDEGNNWSRACPLYAATMSCDREFRWRVQFMGQANCEGKKDGESIWKLVKQIFVAAALLHVYKKICAAGTDGASVMRSTRHFRGA